MENFTKLQTLSRAKDFEWKISEDNLYIRREFFVKEESVRVQEDSFAFEDIDKIISFVDRKTSVKLDNSVTEMRAPMDERDERYGLGRFIYDNIKSDLTYAQSSSQLVAILTRAGILSWNGKKNGMEFSLKTNNWKEPLISYYEDELLK